MLYFSCVFRRFLLLNRNSFLLLEVLQSESQDLRPETGLCGWVRGGREIALSLKPEEVLMLLVFCPLSGVS